QPVQPRETELQFRLDAGEADDPESRRRIGGVTQQRCLADARLTPDHQRGAQPAAGGVQHLIQGLPLHKPIHQRHGPRLRVAATRHTRSRRRGDPVADRLRRGQHLTEIRPARDATGVPRLRGSPDSTNARRRESGLTCRGPVPAAELESYAMTVITGHEDEQISKANASGLAPVVFVHGLWLLPSSWDRWAAVFADAGYAPLTPSWPDDPGTVEEANEHPEVFARKTV